MLKNIETVEMCLSGAFDNPIDVFTHFKTNSSEYDPSKQYIVTYDDSSTFGWKICEIVD